MVCYLAALSFCLGVYIIKFLFLFIVYIKYITIFAVILLIENKLIW